MYRPQNSEGRVLFNYWRLLQCLISPVKLKDIREGKCNRNQFCILDHNNKAIHSFSDSLLPEAESFFSE